MYDNVKIILLENWLLNLKKNINNEEILLITFKNILPKRSFLLFTEFQNMITSFYPIAKEQIINLTDLKYINQIDDQKNIILIRMSNINNNNNQFKDYNKNILYIKFDNYNIGQLTILFNKVQNIKSLNKLQIKQDLEYLFYIKKRDPLTVIKQNYSSIINLINNFNHTVLKSNKTISDYIWFKYIKEEINILIMHKILTSQLAVAIYRASTLQFSDSNTKIGIFYRKSLGIKSRTIHFPDIYKGKIKLNIKIKGYNLQRCYKKD